MCKNCSLHKYNSKNCQHASNSLDCPIIQKEIARLQQGLYVKKCDISLGSVSVSVANAKQTKPCTIGLFYARSVCNKIYDILELMQENKLDILCVTESWLNVWGAVCKATQCKILHHFLVKLHAISYIVAIYLHCCTLC